MVPAHLPTHSITRTRIIVRVRLKQILNLGHLKRGDIGRDGGKRISDVPGFQDLNINLDTPPEILCFRVVGKNKEEGDFPFHRAFRTGEDLLAHLLVFAFTGNLDEGNGDFLGLEIVGKGDGFDPVFRFVILRDENCLVCCIRRLRLIASVGGSGERRGLGEENTDKAEKKNEREFEPFHCGIDPFEGF